MTGAVEQRNEDSAFSRFRRRFWMPPRPHGDVIEERSVSFLELFYDLVYVVLIARAAHTLADHVTWDGFFNFAVIFGLIWNGWLNGTLYHELHGREDGRSRTFIFLQMLVLAILAVYTGDAAGSDGRMFAVIYAGLMLIDIWLYYSVRRRDTEEYMGTTGAYIIGLITTMALMIFSAFLPADQRMLLWGVIVVAWVIGTMVLAKVPGGLGSIAISVSESLVERFGLFIIIVLGEVVVGVVDGLSSAERNLSTTVTGALALTIGFGLWWNYFDFAGRRLPRRDAYSYTRWLLSHLPLTLGIAAAGAAMVSLVEHSSDDRTPVATAWLLSGSFALALLMIGFVVSTLEDFERVPSAYRPLLLALAVGAVLSLMVAWLRPAPWLFALVLFLILCLTWAFAIQKLILSGTQRTFFRSQ